MVSFEYTYAEAVPELSVPWQAASFPDPRPVLINEPLAAELGLDPEWLRSPEGVAMLVGTVPAGSPTWAQAYAGHQFGTFVPQLGDGRALLLGELRDTAGRRRDLHLKGSGRTPFARGGDGYAVLGPMLREYVVGESMHALGIPTTRALAVVTTGAGVHRDYLQPGAVLCRVAASHLRVGTFQYAAQLGTEKVRALTDYALRRHYPERADDLEPARALLTEVSRAQADLVAQWMLIGFIHGVMNTDNMTISGESIDFGPCAYLDGYHPATVFSSIDRQGRYAYGNQPAIAQWNLARFAETLLPLLDPDSNRAVEIATEVLTGFAADYHRAFDTGLARKLGLGEPDAELQPELLELLTRDSVDWTGFFRALAAGTAAEAFADPAPFEAWAARWAAQGPDVTAMDTVNPMYIPRNHVLQLALLAAEEGDLGELQRLLGAVTDPCTARPGLEDLARGTDASFVTYCGT
ncbi:protein adenylyltransferase SelO [Granulicoccus phenolivorans]|uniref:protein adenylyltransferase SelO n=1 Tax=Granulicoccus phenolivorans TaxID=266854 RepID=UPI000401B321|nr:YdiU family protein [Granulicoccus phenolivorans]